MRNEPRQIGAYLEAVAISLLVASTILALALYFYVIRLPDDFTISEAVLAFFLLLWVPLPYFVLYRLGRSARRSGLKEYSPLAACVTAILIFGFTAYAYIDAFFIHVSSTSGVIFVPVPLFLMVGGPVVFGITVMIAKALGIRTGPSGISGSVCQKCGYLLRGLPEPRCPECGTAFDPKLLD